MINSSNIPQNLLCSKLLQIWLAAYLVLSNSIYVALVGGDVMWMVELKEQSLL